MPGLPVGALVDDPSQVPRKGSVVKVKHTSRKNHLRRRAAEVDAEAMLQALAGAYDYRSPEDAAAVAEQLLAVGEDALAQQVNVVLAPNTPEGWQAMFDPECGGQVYSWYTEVLLPGRWADLGPEAEYVAYSPVGDEYYTTTAERLEGYWAQGLEAIARYFKDHEDDPPYEAIVLPEVEANVAYEDYAPV